MVVRFPDDPPTSSRLSQPRLVALLCYLALARPRGLHARDTLIALLWPSHDSARGRRALRNALHALRRTLGEDVIVTAGDQLVGVDPTRLHCDAHALERGRVHEEADVGVEPLHGLHVNAAAPFDRWLSNERARLVALLARETPSVAPRPARPARPYSPDAWVWHARGHYLFLRATHGGSTDDLLRCRDHFARALALDPTYAPAIAGLANFHAVAARRGVLGPFHTEFARTIAYSEQALALDDTLAVPHVHFGVQALYLDGDFERAGRAFATAVRNDPAYAEGHRFLGVWLGMAGRAPESVQAMERAVTLEPDIPHFLSSLGAAHLLAGDRAAAEAALRQTLLLDPRHKPARERLLAMLEDDGRWDEAQAERERAPALADAAAFRTALAQDVAAYRALLHEQLLRDIEALEARCLRPPTETPVDELFAPPVVRLVQLYARVGQWKRARSWQVQARAARPVLAHWFRALPELAGGRG